MASWYSSALTLQLGTRFHRSHITLVASQVSELPAAVSRTWTKAPLRGGVASGEELRPAAALTALRVRSPGGRGGARLDEGKEVAAEISYDGVGTEVAFNCVISLQI